MRVILILNKVRIITQVDPKVKRFLIKKMPIKTHKRQVNKKKTDGRYAQWSDKQKFEAVTMFLLVGKMILVSDATGIPIDTLRHWKMTDWWKEYENEIRRSKHIETTGKLAKIRDKASDVVLDRLEHGDFQYNPKTGQFVRRPVNAKTASEIMVKSIDKETLLEKLDEKPEESHESIMDRLNHIADKLLQAAGKVRKPQILEATLVVDEVADVEESDVQHHEVSQPLLQEEPRTETSQGSVASVDREGP